mgnify:FL=1
MIKVYLDYGSTTEWIATFRSDSLYMECLGALEQVANVESADLIERVVEESDDE